MDIFKLKAITDRMPSGKNTYDRAARWFRGDRNAIDAKEAKALKKIVDDNYKNFTAAIDLTINNLKTK